VKQIRQASSDPQRPIAFSSLTLCLRASLILLIGFMMNIALMSAAQCIQPSKNLFARFADVFPGQLRDTVEAHGFVCRLHRSAFPTDENCTMSPETGIFSQIGLVISAGSVRHVTFLARENALRLGDLAVIYGTPTMRAFGTETYFMWLGGGIMASTRGYAGGYSLFLPIWSVSFTDAGKPS
jgi:hypothetical protein